MYGNGAQCGRVLDAPVIDTAAGGSGHYTLRRPPQMEGSDGRALGIMGPWHEQEPSFFDYGVLCCAIQ